MNTLVKIIGGAIILLVGGCDNSEVSNMSSQDSSDSVSVTIPYSRLPDTVVLNEEHKKLFQELNTSILTEIKTVSEIPEYITAYLDSTQGGFDIANPGEEWQEGCIVQGKSIQTSQLDSSTGIVTVTTSFDPTQPLPWRQLVYFGMNDNIALMAYNSGGWGKSEHLIILKLSNNHVLYEWHETAPAELNNKEDILDFLNKY
jgi:hypothetical protein